MVPLSFHSFFSTTAEVAGTLIGLLFVAVSLSPEKLDGGDVEYQVRAGVAFVALTNALVLSLLAVAPGVAMGSTGIILSGSGLSSALGLAVISFRHADLGRRLRVLFRVAALIGFFGVQLAYSIALALHPRDQSPLQAICVVTVVSFVFAIERAWELIGGDGAGVVMRFGRLLVDRPSHRPSPPSPPAGEAGRPSGAGDDTTPIVGDTRTRPV